MNDGATDAVIQMAATSTAETLVIMRRRDGGSGRNQQTIAK
jgi:hypothetical protein